MLRAAAKHHALRWGTSLSLLLLTTFVAQQAVSRMREENDHKRAESLVEAVLTAPAEAVPYAIENLRPLRHHALPILRERLADETREKNQRLHAALGLAALGEVDEAFLIDAIADASAAEGRSILAALATTRETAIRRITARTSQEKRPIQLSCKAHPAHP
jgi:hypothetical protein